MGSFAKTNRPAVQPKFKAKSCNGFPSRLESAVNDMLISREKAGDISDIRRQQTVVLQDGPRETRITIRIDFVAFDKKEQKDFAIEAKGFETRDYKLKLKLWRRLPPMKLEIWGGRYDKLKLIEVVGE